MERRVLVLRGLANLPEHLRRGRLVEANRVVGGAADDSDRLEHAQHAQPGDVSRELGLFERQLHEADRAEVVDLVRLHLLDRGDQRRQVLEVALDQLERRILVLDHLGLRVRLASHEPEDLIALAGQELGHVPAVLARDPGDERAFHVVVPPWEGTEASRAANSIPGRVGAGTRRTAPPRRARRSRRRRRAARRAPGGSPDWSGSATARSPIPATPTGAGGRGRGGSRPGSTRTPRRRRGRALRGGPTHRGTGASARPPPTRRPAGARGRAREQTPAPRARRRVRVTGPSRPGPGSDPQAPTCPALYAPGGRVPDERRPEPRRYHRTRD